MAIIVRPAGYSDTDPTDQDDPGLEQPEPVRELRLGAVGHLGDLARDGETQARAAVSAGGGGVHLRKWQEKFFLILFGNTRSRIGNADENFAVPDRAQAMIKAREEGLGGE